MRNVLLLRVCVYVCTHTYRMDRNFRGTKLSRFSRISGHPRKSTLSSFLWSQNGRRHTDCTIPRQSTFAPLTIFLHRERTALSKIHLCFLAIPDNFRSFYYRSIDPTLLQQELYTRFIGCGWSIVGSDFPSLEDVLPGSTAQAVCDELSKDRSNKLTETMLLMSADFFISCLSGHFY